MNCRSVIFLCLLAVFANLYASAQSRTKKVVIHVPYKINRIKHTHTVYKTVHHHHRHREPVHISAPTEEHEHFHHVHVHDEQLARQRPQPGLALSGFLPADLNLAELPAGSIRSTIPLYRRATSQQKA